MYSEEFYRLALRYLEGYGNVALKKMLSLSGSATNLFQKPELWRAKISKNNKRIKVPKINADIKAKIEKQLNLMQKREIKHCFYTDLNYPYRLKRCNDSPLSFFYKGSADFNAPKTLAIVGTRNATEYGLNGVKKILSELRDMDVVTVSGLAYGIDTAVHERSIEYTLPTVAVMGSGLGNIYPRSNEQLARKIIDRGGAVISEFDYDAIPDRTNFPKRNRIIAGMSDATLVVETGLKGGSIITAYIAHSYNRDVFALPGSIFDEFHEGCHELIRKNMAAIVTSGEQLVEMMNWEAPKMNVQTALFIDLTDTEQKVVDVICSSREASIDKISESLPEFTPSKLSGILLGLELKGVIVCKPGKVYAIS